MSWTLFYTEHLYQYIRAPLFGNWAASQRLSPDTGSAQSKVTEGSQLALAIKNANILSDSKMTAWIDTLHHCDTTVLLFGCGFLT